jgi:hypothetical protein
MITDGSEPSDKLPSARKNLELALTGEGKGGGVLPASPTKPDPKRERMSDAPIEEAGSMEGCRPEQ